MDNVWIAVLISALAILAEHYFPWRATLGRELPRVAAYALGVLAIEIPLTILFVEWGLIPAALALWQVTAGAGLACLAAYAFDSWLAVRRAQMLAIEREQQLRKSLIANLDDDEGPAQ